MKKNNKFYMRHHLLVGCNSWFQVNGCVFSASGQKMFFVPESFDIVQEKEIEHITHHTNDEASPCYDPSRPFEYTTDESYTEKNINTIHRHNRDDIAMARDKCFSVKEDRAEYGSNYLLPDLEKDLSFLAFIEIPPRMKVIQKNKQIEIIKESSAISGEEIVLTYCDNSSPQSSEQPVVVFANPENTMVFCLFSNRTHVALFRKNGYWYRFELSNQGRYINFRPGYSVINGETVFTTDKNKEGVSLELESEHVLKNIRSFCGNCAV